MRCLRVQAVCEKLRLPYTTGSFLVQYAKMRRTIAKLSLPNKHLRDTADNAPETRRSGCLTSSKVSSRLAIGQRRGLKTAIATVKRGYAGTARRLVGGLL